MIEINEAKEGEFEWINQQYKGIGFVKSNPDKDTVLIARYYGEKAGIGRLVRLDNSNYELGGIFTLEQYRGQHIADSIVANLIKIYLSRKAENLYCIPFEKLFNFYFKHGFRKVTDNSTVHNRILEKYNFCLVEYVDRVSIMKLE